MKLVQVCALLCISGVSFAQMPADTRDAARQRESVASLIDSMAASIYRLAWPTATYKTWSFADFERVPGGYQVVVKFSGISAFDDSDLWMKLGILINSDGVKNVSVVDHNAILAPPFQTSESIGALTLQIAKQYSNSHAARPSATAPKLSSTDTSPTQAGAVCIINSTGRSLIFSYRWSGNSWQQLTLPSNDAETIWWPYEPGASQTSPALEIEYDDSFDEGYTGQRYLLDRYPSSLPVNCKDAKEYRFSAEGQAIFLKQAN